MVRGIEKIEKKSGLEKTSTHPIVKLTRTMGMGEMRGFKITY